MNENCETDAKAKDCLNLPIRPRRNRKTQNTRDLIAETNLEVGKLIYPMFVHAGANNEEIKSMPGHRRLTLDGTIDEIEKSISLGLRNFVFFPAIADSLKNPHADEAWNPDGLVPRLLKRVREEFGEEVTLISDVALDPYNSDGHDGVVDADGKILNDETITILCKQALAQAQAGADIIAPSDMMDGRVAALRRHLDASSLQEVSIMSYTAKYASAFYGPFRGALDSAPKSGDKKTYQMDCRNRREAVREAALDEAEGADILMVKPALPYLDVLADLRRATNLPLAAYQVSGEYLALVSAAQTNWLDLEACMLETLTAIRRAGADMILTYFAPKFAKMLAQ